MASVMLQKITIRITKIFNFNYEICGGEGDILYEYHNRV